VNPGIDGYKLPALEWNRVNEGPNNFTPKAVGILSIGPEKLRNIPDIFLPKIRKIHFL
jgi:hypothetical protein